MQAIIETGGKQYRVAPGDVVRVGKIDGAEGAEVHFGKVLAVFKDEGELVAGDSLGSSIVTGTIVRNARAPKVLVFKFKRKKQYKKTIGHRQDFTEVRVGEIRL